MNLVWLKSPSLSLPQSRVAVKRDFNVRSLINVGSGYINLVSGRPCTLTGAVQRAIGPSGRRFYAAVSSVYAESPTGLSNDAPVTLVAVSTSTSGSSMAGISNAPDYSPVPQIDCAAGVLTATCRVAGGTFLSITGPTVTVGKTYAAALHWRPGVGLRASFNGGDVQLASHSATTLYVTPGTLWMGGSAGSNVYFLAALAGELSDAHLRDLSNNPWILLEAEDHQIWWPAAASAGVEASGALQSISLVAPAGSATGSATASAAFSTASLSSPTGAATGSATASAAFSTASLSSPTGAATGSATTGGSLAPLSLSAPAGSAAGAATASASLPTATLSAPTGTAVGACLASGAISGLSIAPPTGTAFSGAGTVANGVLSQISLSAPTGGATGNAAAAGALQGISLSASLGSASGAASCSGALPTILITPCSGSASTAVPASRASGSVFCRIDTPRAVVRIATSQCTVRVP